MNLPIVLLSVACIALSVTCILQEIKINKIGTFVVRLWEFIKS